MYTLQVFGRLIRTAEGASHGMEGREVGSGPLATVEPQERNNDLREHMVGILFSRSKLTHLQKQVRAHVHVCMHVCVCVCVYTVVFTLYLPGFHDLQKRSCTFGVPSQNLSQSNLALNSFKFLT